MQNAPDQKRLVIAVVLSLAVLLGWSYLFPPQTPQPVANASAPQSAPPAAGAAPEAQPAMAAAAPLAEVRGRDIVVETPLYRAVFNTAGGVCSSFELRRFKQTIARDSREVNLISPAASQKKPFGVYFSQYPTWEHFTWGDALGEGGASVSELRLGDGRNATLTFQAEGRGLRILRTLTFDPTTYYIAEQCVIHNTSAEPKSVQQARFTLANESFSAKDDSYNPPLMAAMGAKGLEQEKDLDTLAKEGLTLGKGLLWGGAQNNHFLAVLTLPGGGEGNFLGKREGDVFLSQISREIPPVAPGAQVSLGTGYFLGPKDQKILDALPGDLGDAIDYGWFSVIAKPMLLALHFFHGIVGNYGVAIILVTIIIKLLLWPLSGKSYKSMEQMKKLQPMMAKIREKHGEDKVKMNQEMMALYKTYKVNPMGGCLPMVLQIPVFIALYNALLGAIELRHAAFISHVPFTDIVWLADLSARDPFYVTPLIMGGTMFLQQKLMPPPGDPTQAKIMLFMPVIFTFMFLNFPSGLVVYWLVNNVLSIVQQKIALKNT